MIWVLIAVWGAAHLLAAWCLVLNGAACEREMDELRDAAQVARRAGVTDEGVIGHV